MELKAVWWRKMTLHSKNKGDRYEPAPEIMEWGKKRRELERKMEEKALREELEQDNFCW